MNIIAAECLFPSGPSIELADIAVKTQLSLTRKHPFFVDQCGERINVCFFPSVTTMDKTRWEKMANEILSNLKKKLDVLPTPSEYRLWLLLPEQERAGIPNDLEDILIKCIFVITSQWREIHVLKGSHAQAGIALQNILSNQNMNTGKLIYDVVFGVDSYLLTATLMQLESQRLIHNSFFMNAGKSLQNPYGFIPSEGAAAVVFSSGLNLGCRLNSVAIDYENNLRGTDIPCIGTGLTQAARKALTGITQSQLAYIVSDMNGEPYRADEYGFTLARLNLLVPNNYIKILPVLATGDLGCVSLMSHIAIMSYRHILEKESDKNRYSLILSSSLDKLRSVVVLSDF